MIQPPANETEAISCLNCVHRWCCPTDELSSTSACPDHELDDDNIDDYDPSN